MDDPAVLVGVAPSRQGTIQTGPSWMWFARYSAAASILSNRSRLVPGAGSPARYLGANLLVPRAFVAGSDSLLDLRIADDQEPPALHISSAWGTHARPPGFGG